MPSFEYRDGRLVQVPDLLVTEDTDVREEIHRTVHVRPGAALTTRGEVHGTVTIERGAVWHAYGKVQGTVHVQGEATFHADYHGTLAVERDATLTLMAGCSAIGTTNIHGLFINYGTRGGITNVTGRIDDRPGSSVRHGRQEAMPDGTVVNYFD